MFPRSGYCEGPFMGVAGGTEGLAPTLVVSKGCTHASCGLHSLSMPVVQQHLQCCWEQPGSEAPGFLLPWLTFLEGSDVVPMPPPPGTA